MDCNVEGCENKATLRYVWAWGEEGACCDAHRPYLESKATQLGRGIAFTDGGRAREPYAAPRLEQLAPEVGQLRLRVAELTTDLQDRDAQIVILKDELARVGVAKRAESFTQPQPVVVEQPDVTETTTPVETRRKR